MNHPVHQPERRTSAALGAQGQNEMSRENGGGIGRVLKKLLAVLITGLFALQSVAVSAQTVTYVHTDLLGSATTATNNSGAVVWSQKYTAYGSPYASSGTNQSNIGYAAGTPDGQTGFVYFHHRYYDPSIGRFLSVDPVSFQIEQMESFNRYQYANNNPYTYVDPDGRFSIVAGLAIGALVLIAGYAVCQSCREANADLASRIRDAIGGYSPSAYSDRGEMARRFTTTGARGAMESSSGGGSSGPTNHPMSGAGQSAPMMPNDDGSERTRSSGGRDHIVVGLSGEGLESTARAVNGRTLMNVQGDFRVIFNRALQDPNTRFTIRLDGLSGATTEEQIMNGVNQGLRRGTDGGFTNWELSRLHEAGRLGDAQLIRNGQYISNPFR